MSSSSLRISEPSCSSTSRASGMRFLVTSQRALRGMPNSMTRNSTAGARPRRAASAIR